MNKKRQTVFDKSGGLCWYCGCELQKGWHVDHFHPVVRSSEKWKNPELAKEWGINTSGLGFPENDTEENKVPSCPQCNLLKSSLTIEHFRQRIGAFINSLNSYTNQYKFAKKYGLVKETNNSVVFWFELNIKDGGE